MVPHSLASSALISSRMGSEDLPPLGPKPKSALPSYLLNGGASVRMPSSTRERENLNSSIRSSFARRQAIDLDLSKDIAESQSVTGTRTQCNERPANMDNSNKLYDDSSPVITKRNLSEPPRDPRDQAAPLTPPSTISRPASPYTLNPPIDFDGLSWPSMSLVFPFIFD